MKTSFIGILIAILCSVATCDELVKNSQFSIDKKTEKIANWKIINKGDSEARPSSNGILLSVDDEKSQIIVLQYLNDIQPSTEYIVSFNASAPKRRIKLSPYVEWFTKKNKCQGVWKTFVVSSNKEKLSFKFTSPANFGDLKAKPYLAFRVKHKGKVLIETPAVNLVSHQ